MSARPAVAQKVNAVAGFAYGVIGADIHVFGDGVPVYVLENWRGVPQADPAWLRQMPSRMLNARFALVEFTGRAGDLTKLRRWRQDGSRLAVHWLHGPGGAGKTRLAAEFAGEAAADGWKVITATHGPGMVLPPPGSQDLRLDGVAGVLMVVDYADRWPHSHLMWLFRNALLHQLGVPARVLLLGRTAEALPALRSALTDQVASSSQALEPLPDGVGQREQMFTAARDGFAARYRIDPAGVPPPPHLDAPEMGLTLALHMAALVAVDARVTGRRLPADMAGLSVYLLDREHQHWATRYADRSHNLDVVPAYRTPPHVMNHTVYTAALTGTVSRHAGAALLTRLQLPHGPDRVLNDHAICYPPGHNSTDGVLEPLYPDRLAEDFLALTMPGHHADYPAQKWAAATTTTILASHDRPEPGTADGDIPHHLSRAVTFLAAATDRWPHLGDGYLYPLLREHPHLVIAAGSPALTTLANVRDVDITVLEAIERLFPADRHVDLDTGVAAVTTTLTRHRLTSTTDPGEHAELHDIHARRLTNAGHHQQALAPSLHAVTIRRQLARADPVAHLPDLASSINNLGLRLSAVGRRAEAMTYGQEGTDIYRRLAEANPAVYLPDFASSLNNLGVLLSELGRREEALTRTQEAVTIRRRLLEDSPAAYRPVLAGSLNNLGIRLSELGRRDEALPPAAEATGIFRRLAEENPAAYLPDLASSLTNLGTRLSQLGRRDEALPAAEEATGIFRRLAKANPAAYLPNLAGSLDNLGAFLTALGRPDDALGPAADAVAVRRRLAEANPAAYLPDLAITLNNLGTVLSALGRRGEALAAAEEAVVIRRRLAEANPAAYLPDLATSLNNLGAFLSGLGRRDQALAASEEATGLFRRLAPADPAAYLLDLARSLNNLARDLSASGRRAEALACAEEAVPIRRRLAEANPAAYLPDLAESLTNLGVWLSAVGRRDEALALAEEATGIYRRLAEANPAAHLPGLATSLNNIGIRLSESGRYDEALATAEEAAITYRLLAEANPAAHLPNLAGSLHNLASIQLASGRHHHALASAAEAVTIRRPLAEANPAAYQPDLATSLMVYAWVCVHGGVNLPAALTAIQEAISHYEHLTGQPSDLYATRLHLARRVLTDILDGLGRADEAAELRRQFNGGGEPSSGRTAVDEWSQ